MKLDARFVRHHYLKIFAFVSIIFLLFISFSQFKTNEIYKAYVSDKLSSDFQSLYTSIQDNNTLYKDVLSTGKITIKQQDTLILDSRNYITRIK